MFLASFRIIKVATSLHRDFLIDVPMTDQNVLRLKLGQQKRLVDHPLQMNDFSATQSCVGRDHQPGFGVHDPGREACRRESCKHHRMYEPKPDAGQHGKYGLRNHGKINHDAISTFQPQRFEDRRKSANLFIKLLVSERL